MTILYSSIPGRFEDAAEIEEIGKQRWSALCDTYREAPAGELSVVRQGNRLAEHSQKPSRPRLFKNLAASPEGE